MRNDIMRLHPLHPASWVLDQVHAAGWQVHDLLAFTRASTLILASRASMPPIVLKAGFGSNHVLAELDEDERPAAYGFYWYIELTEEQRALTREDFRHEIDLARDASDAPHVVPLLETGQTDRFDWYTMPYYPTGNFRPLIIQRVATDLRSQLAGLNILADVASGLDALHTRGIVHRDVYQENILIQDGRGYVTDLGAARRTGIPRGPVSRGPEVHWPPEYATAYNTATETADVFSLAVLTYRFLCADIPRYGSAPRLSAVPSSLRDLIVAALAPIPGDRPAMGDLRDALHQAAADAAAPVHHEG